MQNNEDRTRRDGTGQNVSRGSGGRRRKRVKRQKEKMLRREISAILNMPKEIGVSLTDTMLMTPSKSVTALIGISDTPGKCAPAGCAGCAASANCAYARTETES